MAKKKTSKKQPVKKKAKKKNVGGRPTKYKSEYLAVMYKVTELGGTDKDVIAAIGVSERTLNGWKKKYPEVFAALNTGKDFSNKAVKTALFQRAIGYKCKEVRKTKRINPKTKKLVTTEEIEIAKHYPPESTAGIFWLTNRDRENWKRNLEPNGNTSQEIADALTKLAESLPG